jgi:hypothetical protein
MCPSQKSMIAKLNRELKRASKVVEVTPNAKELKSFPTPAPVRAPAPLFTAPTPLVAVPTPVTAPAPLFTAPTPLVAVPIPVTAPAPLVTVPTPVNATPSLTIQDLEQILRRREEAQRQEASFSSAHLQYGQQASPFFMGGAHSYPQQRFPVHPFHPYPHQPQQLVGHPYGYGGMYNPMVPQARQEEMMSSNRPPAMHHRMAHANPYYQGPAPCRRQSDVYGQYESEY